MHEVARICLFLLLGVQHILTMAGKRKSLLPRDDCGDADDGWMFGAVLPRDGWR